MNTTNTPAYDVVYRDTRGPESYGYQDDDSYCLMAKVPTLVAAIALAKREMPYTLCTVIRNATDEIVGYVDGRYGWLSNDDADDHPTRWERDQAAAERYRDELVRGPLEL